MSDKIGLHDGPDGDRAGDVTLHEVTQLGCPLPSSCLPMVRGLCVVVRVL